MFPTYTGANAVLAEPAAVYLAATAAECTHLASIHFVDLPDVVEGCEECLAIGGRWVHLRMCQTCGHVGCCDNSTGQHATVHHRATGHPIIRSAEPGEDWSWCYADELMFRLSG